MRLDLKRPCNDCPFRIRGGIRLHPERAREIARYAIDSQGGTFACHKTVEHDDDGEHVPGNAEQYCAGALLFALNVGSLNQFMRIMWRIGAWDPDAMQDRGAVFKSVAAMMAAQRRAWLWLFLLMGGW